MKYNTHFSNLIPLLLAFCIFPLGGCFSVKPAAKKGARNLVETFYLGDKGTQYFIKPLLFKSVDDKSELRLDATFRYKEELSDSVALNISLIGNRSYREVELLEISNPSTKAAATEFNFLFNEVQKKNFVSRFSTKITLNDLKQLFNNAEWTIRLRAIGDNNYEFQPSKKSKKSINKIDASVFASID
ncbi:MAG: hypothetical protein AB8F94_29980 [Saprospiraceae bacterium]